MSKKEQLKEELKQEACTALRRILKPGDTVYTVLRRVTWSGMSRRIDFYKLTADGPIYLSGWIGDALGCRPHDDGSLIVGGCGTDAGFDTVHHLSYAIHGRDAKTVKASIKALGWNPKHDGPAEKRPGYTLAQRWL